MYSFSLYLLGVLFSQFCAIHYFAYFVSIFSIWETLLENCFLLSVSFHVEHNINFLFSIVAIYARMEIPCALYFHHFSELPWQLLAGGKVVHVCSLSCVWLFVIPWTVAHQASLSMGLSCKNPGVGCHFLLQRIFSAQGSNLHFLWLLYWDGFLTIKSSEEVPK